MQKQWASVFCSGRETNKSHALVHGIDGRGTAQPRTWVFGESLATSRLRANSSVSGMVHVWRTLRLNGLNYYCGGLRRKGRIILVRIGSMMPRENAGDKYKEIPMRTGKSALVNP